MNIDRQSQYRNSAAQSGGGNRPSSQAGMGNQNSMQSFLTFRPSGNPMSPLQPQSPYDEYYTPKRSMTDARSAISDFMSGGNQSRSSSAQPSPSIYGSGRQQQMPFLPGRGSSSTTQPQYDDLLYRFNPDAPAMSKREMIYLGGAFNKPLGSNQGSSLRDFAVPVAAGTPASNLSPAPDMSLLPRNLNSLGISYAPGVGSPQQSRMPVPQVVSEPYQRPNQAYQPFSFGFGNRDDYVKVPYSPELFADAPAGYSSFQAPRFGSSAAYVNPETTQAFDDFNAEARRLAAQPREDLYGMTSKMIADGVEQGRQQGVQDANEIVDRNLSESQGYYATPSQRRSGFFSSGMGALPSDAAIMESQNRPLSDGGPAAAAARADQEESRKRAEDAMGGPSPDGLTRYMPNPDLLAFANQDRRREDQQKFSALQDAGMFPNPQSGSNPNIGTFQREDLKAMTPSEIQFYRHKMNMATNPVYRDRINAKRQARSQDLANQTKTRLEMAANRRQAAADAAGASQQLRNFMSGRGAIGGGQDGFNALMSLAAMQNPNQAFNSYGDSYRALMAPGMQSEMLDASGNMLEKKADLDRLRQFDDMRRDIITSGRSQIEQDRALARLNDFIMAGNGGSGVTSISSPQYTLPSWVDTPQLDPEDKTTPTVDIYHNYMKGITGKPEWQTLSPQERKAIESRIRRDYFPGIRDSDILQHKQDNAPNFFSRWIGYPLQSLFGTDPASERRRREDESVYESYTPVPIPQTTPATQGNKKPNEEKKASPPQQFYYRAR
jgi:hypothetical protein